MRKATTLPLSLHYLPTYLLGVKLVGKIICAEDLDSLKTKRISRSGLTFGNFPDQIPLFYNIAPSQKAPVILNESPDELSFIRWGLIPHWAKAEKLNINPINAKAETITEKPMFKDLIKSKRCLVLADAFYEWKKVGGKKIPFRILLKDGEAFAFAGIWDVWESGGKQIKSCLIITTSANKLVGEIHDRMPVILPREIEKKWLGETNINNVLEVLKPYHSDEMKAYPISKLINSPANNSYAVTKPLPTS